MMCYHQWNLFGIICVETINLKNIALALLIKLRILCEHLPLIFLIWISEKDLKIKKKLQAKKELRKNDVILKPDKGNSVVGIDATDYYE